jgi:hypothetical protein
MARGESGVLTAEDPAMFARTSGTTGEPKLIPVTPTCQGRDHSDPMRTWLYHAQREHPEIFRGKVLSLVSPAVEGHTDAGIPYGSTSGFIYKNLPRPIQSTYLVPYDVFLLEDYDIKYYLLVLLGLVGDVTFLCTANPSTIAKLCEVADERAESLIRDIRDGRVNKELDMPSSLRAEIEKRIHAVPARARELEALRAGRGGHLLPRDFWPNIGLIGCWKGGTVGGYLKRFDAWFDPDGDRPVPVRDWGYLSSEARGSIPLTDEGSGGVLTVATSVIEFVEVEEVERFPDQPDKWTVLGAHQVDAPREYLVIFTTSGGLYRYDINDVVRVEDFYNEAPIITFQRKGRGMTSLTGEKVSVNQVIQAIEQASQATGHSVDHFRAVADPEDARYHFYVECPEELDEQGCKKLLQSIEDNLCQLNLEYDGKRKSQRLKSPRLCLMRPGWYDKEKQGQGQRLFQSKTVLLEPMPDKGEATLVRTMCIRDVEI